MDFELRMDAELLELLKLNCCWKRNVAMNLLPRFFLRFSTPEFTMLFAVVALLLAGYAEAASVYSCSGSRCVVKVEEGVVGDRIKILDDKARPIASGRILKRKGAYAIVSVNDASIDLLESH